ncbi:MAG TPA: SUF system Fe-S cluster assembly protein [Lamprocystis sp. (in: g-proteobacteria)]|nr:SUF system Fe-S cluster assembly protein [Lamprocystis sp. (in: g-proteobacteria)]
MNRLARFAGFGRHAPSGAIGDHADLVVERMDAEELREPIIAALREVHDPEIPVNIYDLGLIYTIAISPSGDVAIDMTLTAPACPVAGLMPVMVKDAVSAVDGVGEVEVELVWDPPWSQEHMSDEAKLQLGML